MVLDISKLLSKDGLVIDICNDIDYGELSFGNQNIRFASPMHIEGYVKSVDGMLQLSLDCSADYVSQCSRCLAPVDEQIDFSVKEFFSKTELDNENDDVIILNSNEIDLKEIAEQGFCCALPITCLCSEDCKGLCPVCGCNLNTEECCCETEDIDPRLAALKDFLNDD